VQDRLMSIYGKGEYNIPSIKRAIIRYMLASTQAGSPAPAGAAGQTSVTGQVHASVDSQSAAGQLSQAEYAERGKKFVEELRKKDPRTVREAERFFFVK
jgi:hypothetical protein